MKARARHSSPPFSPWPPRLPAARCGQAAKTAAVPAAHRGRQPYSAARGSSPPAPLSHPADPCCALPAPQPLNPAAFDVEPIPEPPPLAGAPALAPRQPAGGQSAGCRGPGGGATARNGAGNCPGRGVEASEGAGTSRRQAAQVPGPGGDGAKLTTARQNTIDTIKSFLNFPKRQESHNDMRQARRFCRARGDSRQGIAEWTITNTRSAARLLRPACPGANSIACWWRSAPICGISRASPAVTAPC